MLGILLLLGCGGDGSPAEPPAAKLGSPRQQAAAQRVVDRLWRAVLDKDAALPLFYDDSVLRSVGSRKLSAVLYAPSLQFAVRPRVIVVDRSPLGVSVITESRPGGLAPVRASYLLRKVGAEWKIAFDSNLAQNVDRLVGATRQLRNPLDPAAQPRVMADADLRLRQLPSRRLAGTSRARPRTRGLGPLLTRDYLRQTRASGRRPPGSG